MFNRSVAAISVVVFVAGLFFGLGRLWPAKRPADNREPPSAVLVHETDPSTVHDLAAAASVVKSYFAAATVAERAKFVRHPEIVQPRMFEWHFHEPLAPVLDFKVVRSKATDYHGKPYLGLAVETGGGDPQLLFLERTSDGYRVEWEASVGYQEIRWREFLALRPSNPVRMRVLCAPSDGASPGPAGRQPDWMAVEITHPHDPVTVAGFCRRGSEAGKLLLDILSFNRSAAIIAEMRFPPQDAHEATVEITRVIQNGWILDYDRHE